LASGKIWKLQFDTYEREVERYGGMEATEIAEEIFFADSEAVLAILRATDGDEGMDGRWRIAALGVDRLLGDCGLDASTKRAAMQRLRDAYHREFQVGLATKKLLSDRFRKDRRALETLLADVPERAGEEDTARQLLAVRSTRITEAVRKLRNLDQNGRLSVPIPELADSYVHMHVNI
jgi:thiopeptide-type bacteriocin biosynthesis protein